MSIDQTKHSIFGASKVAADVMAQEYGQYFGMRTGVFRGGCLTGPAHSGAELHGFLAYLVRCAVTGRPYTIYGYKGKQVRDNIHSNDLVQCFWQFIESEHTLETLLPALRQLVTEGLIVVSDVEVIQHLTRSRDDLQAGLDLLPLLGGGSGT